jgi:hypothetical protein
MWVPDPKKAARQKAMAGVAKSNKPRRERKRRPVSDTSAQRYSLVWDGSHWHLDGAPWGRVRVVGSPAGEFLVGIPLRWCNLGKDDDGTVLVQPVPCIEVDAARHREEHSDRLSTMVTSSGSELRPQPPGMSHLETFEGTLTAKAREINRLARDEDKPRAWRALATGWRVEALRDPIKSAILNVGWERIYRFVKESRWPDEWPAGLLEWLEEQKAADVARRRQPAAPKFYLADDYAIADF